MSLHAKPHTRVHVHLAVTCYLHFWQNDLNLLDATMVTWGWNGYQNKRQHQNIDLGEENSPAAPIRTSTRDFLITSLAHYH